MAPRTVLITEYPELEGTQQGHGAQLLEGAVQAESKAQGGSPLTAIRAMGSPLWEVLGCPLPLASLLQANTSSPTSGPAALSCVSLGSGMIWKVLVCLIYPKCVSVSAPSSLLEGKGLGPFLGHSWGRLKQIFGILADTVGLPSQPQDCVLRELLRTEGKVLPLGLRWDHCIHLSLIHTRAPSADWSLLAPSVLGKGRRWRSNPVSSAYPGGGLLVLVPELAR